MKSLLVLIFLATAGFAAATDQKPTPAQGNQKKPVPQSKSNRQVQQSITGCVDEQDGNYVLLDDRMQNKLANLEAVGASNEAFFAKHLGHTVTVKGKRSSEQDGNFKVSSIEDVAQICAPAQSTNPQ